jgi:AcrR family transcriptional regulator
MVRQRVEVRREAILVATIEQIEAHGMAAVRVADVAAALHVSSGLVFYHFDTKNALIIEALGYAVERDLRRLDKALSRSVAAPERLKRVLSSYGPTGSAPSWTLWIDAWATALREPTIRSALRRLDDRWRTALVDAVADGVAAGDFVCADPAAVVARITALLDGLSVAVLVYRTVTRSQLRRWVREATAAELGLDPAVLE